MRPNLAVFLVAAALIGPLWLPGHDAAPPHRVGADATNPTSDTDGDGLPDTVEWAVLTNATSTDTDNDGIDDFIEVVQHSDPRRLTPALPPDNEARIVVTSNISSPGAEPQTWLHLLFRFMGDPSLMTSFSPWVEISQLPGIRFDLSCIACSSFDMMQRDIPGEGRCIRISLPLVSENIIRTVLPCTIGADMVIGQRVIHSAVPLFDFQGAIATLTPYHNGFAVQSISASQPFTGGGSNLVCVLQLTDRGTSEAGTAYQVTAANCDDCNDLECGVGCASAVGWVFVLPGGVESITGGG